MLNFLARNLDSLLATYGYLAVFVFVGIESIGIPVPGETMLVTAAIYAGTTGRLSIFWVIVASAAGAKRARLRGAELLAGLPQQSIDEEASAHPDAPVDPPDGQLHTGFSQHFVPGEHMLIDAVDERPVEVEEQRRGPFRHKPSVAR